MKNPFTSLFRARDKPQDSVSAAPTFYFGTSGSGKAVNATTAIQLSTVYACVRVISETVASLPLGVYEATDEGNRKATEHPLYRLLHDEPNSEMTSFVLREVMLGHLLLWGNSYSQIIRNGRNKISGVYPLLPDKIAAIAEHDSTNPDKGYNLTKGGRGSLGTTHSEEWKRRNSNLMRGRKLSPEKRAHLSDINRGKRMPQLTRENNGFYGKRHTTETLAVISAKSRAKVFTDEIRRHMSDGKRGRPRFRAVICVEQGKRYPTLKAAAKSVGLNYSCISEAARVPHHTAGGYHWRFDEAV